MERTAIHGQEAAQAAPFASPAFQQVWERSDALVALGAVSRTWLWGPTPGFSTREAFADSPGGSRLVQYFDKGRMEISNPNTPPADPYFVTNGLLAYELISGQQQIGQAQYSARRPAAIPVAGDRDDPNAPTYASFRPVSNLPGAEHRTGNAVGQPVAAALARDGSISAAAHGDYGVRVAYWEETTGHNVPDVFWAFLNSPATVLENGQVVPRRLFDPWLRLTGLPISEAYWSYVKIGTTYTDVLIQPFERRVLTYAPNNPEGFKVEMGNIGLHYQEWRYSPDGGGTLPPAPTAIPTAPPSAPPPDVRVTLITTQKPGLDLNFQSVALLNAGPTPVDMTGWRLLTPHNDHDEVYTFPRFILAAGAPVTVYAGWGNANSTQLFMSRITWFFAGLPSDGVILYDRRGQEVTRFFLTGGVAPTAAPLSTPIATATSAPGAATNPPAATTPSPTVEVKPSATPTATLPGAQASVQPTLSGGTRTPTATMTVTPGGTRTTATVTGTPSRSDATATATPSALPSGTPTPRVFSDGTQLLAWIDPSIPQVNNPTLLLVELTRRQTPVVGANMAATWHYPNGDNVCPPDVTDEDGQAGCLQVVRADAVNRIIWVDIQLRTTEGTLYTTNTGFRPAP